MILCDGRQRFCPAPPDLRLEFNVDLPNPVGVPSFVEYSVCDVGACSPFLGLPGQYPTISTRAIYNPVTLGPTGALVPEPAIAFTTPESNHTVLRLFVLYGVMVRAAPPDSYSVHVYLENFTTGNLDIKKADPLPDYWQFSYKSGCSCLVDRVKTPEYFDSQGNLAYNVTLYRNGVFVDDFVGTIDPWNEGGGTIDPPPIGP
jgi:hypothetical protein